MSKRLPTPDPGERTQIKLMKVCLN